MSIELAGVLIALVVGLLSWWASHRAKEFADESVRIASGVIAANRFDQLRSWASEVISAMADAQFAADTNEPGKHKARLSALIDQGRLFMPNTGGEADLTSKPAAYKGSRHATLDPLVAAIRVLDGELKDERGANAVLWQLRREFVTRVQRILAPENFNFDLLRQLRRAGINFDDDPTLGGLLTDGDAPGASALLDKLREGTFEELHPSSAVSPSANIDHGSVSP